MLNTVSLNSTITKDADVPAKININVPNEKIINTKTNIPTIDQSELSIDESKIVSSDNNNHVSAILNTVSLNSTIIKDTGIHAKININIPNKKSSTYLTRKKTTHLQTLMKTYLEMTK